MAATSEKAPTSLSTDQPGGKERRLDEAVVVSDKRKLDQEAGVVSEKQIADLEDLPISQADLDSLRRTPGHINLAAFLIAIVELAERFSYYGVTAVLVNFIQQPRPSRTGASYSTFLQSGALDRGQRTATAISTFNSFWVVRECTLE